MAANTRGHHLMKLRPAIDQKRMNAHYGHMRTGSILCLGDSLTRGGVGWSYINFSAYRTQMLNEGVDGNTIWKLTQRLPRLLKLVPQGSPCIIGIGTNDTLLRHMATVPGWKKSMGMRSRAMHCIQDDGEFADAYRALLSRVTKANLTPVIMGLPLTEMAGYPHSEHEARSRILRQIAADGGHPYVDTAAAMESVGNGAQQLFLWSSTPLPRILDAFTMQIAPSAKDAWAKHRHLELTVDGIHWSSKSAKAVAKAVDHALHGLEIIPSEY